MTYQRKITLSLIVVAALFATLLGLVVYPTVMQIDSISRQIEQERLKLDAKLSQGANLGQTREDLEFVQAEIVKLQPIFIPAGQELDLVSDLEQLAEEYQVDLKIDADLDSQMGAEKKDIELNLALTGGYLPIMSFLRSLEQKPFYYNPNFLIISDQDKADHVKAQIAGQIYLTD